MPRAGSRRRTPASRDARQRLLVAATTLLSTKGYAGATARAIGDEAGCNQALVFYHYGTLNDLLLAALDASSQERLQRYQAELDKASGLREVLGVARNLYRADRESGHINLVAQMVAGGVVDRDLGRQVAQRVEPWIELTRNAVETTLPGALRRRLPVADIAYVIVAMALGTQLLAILSGDHNRTQAALDRLTRSRGLLRGLGADDTR
jgi:AcrR family transcriptional regulator